MMPTTDIFSRSRLAAAYKDHIQFDASLARYTAARIGGPADALLTANSLEDLNRAANDFWSQKIPFFILGAGSNVLISDLGVRGIVILNKARSFRFLEEDANPYVWSESGANFGAIARAAGRKGFSGLEWAAGIPGTVGGAVVGNAGAHGGDMSENLIWADILFENEGVQRWDVNALGMEYRTTRLKKMQRGFLVLSAQMQLEHAEPEAIETRMESYLAHRKRTQPPGASMGSMFKNPQNDFAGRLIEVAGLKGTRIGDAEISPLHGNFFINHGKATAADVLALIQMAKNRVIEQFGVALDLEIELLGEWKPGSD